MTTIRTAIAATAAGALAAVIFTPKVSHADGPFGTVTRAQYAAVDTGMTRHHVEHRIFVGPTDKPSDDVTGVFLARWRGPAGWVHVCRAYRERDGLLIEICYHRANADRPLREYAKSRGNE